MSSLSSYITGFSFSIILTVVPYLLVVKHSLNRNSLIAVVVLCAILQLLVQLKYFLHLSFSPKSRENLLTFIFTIIVVLIIVVGSIWIMHDLNYFMMDPIMKNH